MEILEKILSENSSEFIFKGEDHTIANILSSELREVRGVLHSGYRIPHPLSNEVVVYVQTDGSISPKQAVKLASDKLVSELTKLVDLVSTHVD
ncbi:MAG: RpoL/Rpb11 RNA polymerase subunit family protein [Thermoprotei archaeon]